jgi:uncharacterized protein YecT (DUF1311 family)
MQERRLAIAALKCLVAAAALLAVAGDARAFDCAKASSRFEKAICADPKAHAADEAMSKAFSDLTASANAKARATITRAQLDWLQERNNTCSEVKAEELSACLARESLRRAAFLSGQPEQGPGAPDRILPWFLVEKGGKGRAEVDMELLKFADPKTPGERAFNNATAKFLDDITQPEKGDPNPDRYAFTTRMRLVYASPRLVSAQADVYADGGGAHPNSYIGNVNVLLADGRVVELADILDAKSAEKVFALCLGQVQAAQKQRVDDEPLTPDDLEQLAKNIKDATSGLGAWSFEATQAVVTYSPYSVGAYVEGYYDCKIGYDWLRPLVKASFPLP